MIRILKVELTKVVNYPTFWVIFGIHLLLLIPAVFAFESFVQSVAGGTGPDGVAIQTATPGVSIFNFPGAWHNLAYLASWFQFILVILFVILVTNEYTYKTLRQNIIDGLSAVEIIAAKEVLILFLTAVSTLMLFALTAALGKPAEGVGMFDGVVAVPAYFMSLFLFLHLAYFLSSWLKKTGLVIGMLIIYWIVEGIAGFWLPDSVSQLLPMNVRVNMLPNPLSEMMGLEAVANVSLLNGGLCLAYAALFLGGNYWLLKHGHAAK